MKLLGILAAVAAIGLGTAAGAQGLYEEPGRPELFPKNFGYEDDRPELFPKNYGYRYEKPKPAEKWRNPWSGRDRRETTGGYSIRDSGGSDITGFRPEPTGGGSPWDRVR